MDPEAKELLDKIRCGISWCSVWLFFIMLNTCSSCGGHHA